ncbi:30S ribosomal protein S6 [Rhodospirillaceae bacterium SYSU D60014]|uniref:30S ribosomal protein S6 n=1 Tax=Virgifigura deserti TaxID=2268457 RepID=UPI000E6746C7
MPLYESVFITRQDISAAQAESLSETFANIIAEQGGTVAKKEYWGLKNLAFRMKKNRKGHYTLFNIDAPAAAVLEMERNMRLNEDILRYLTVRVDELEEGPSAMLQSRHRDREGGREGGSRFRDRDDRPRRDDDRPRRDRNAATAESGEQSEGEGA